MKNEQGQEVYKVVVVCKNCKGAWNCEIPFGVEVRKFIEKDVCGLCGCVYGWDGFTVWGTRLGGR